MPSFDAVNQIDLQDLDNAINNANKKIAQRYDFRGAETLLELNKKDKTIKIEAPDDMKMKAMQEIIRGCLHDQAISPKVIDWGKEENASLGAVRIHCKLNEGIDKEAAKKITAKIKESGLKVKSSIQGEQIRVEAKSIDDLQAIIAELKTLDLPVPLQFVNMKR